MRTEEPTTRTNQSTKRPRKRVVRAIALLIVAGGAAVFAALLLTRYMDARTAGNRVPMVKVVVATVDIPAAVPIKAEWVTAIDWPVASCPEGVQGDATKLIDRVPLAAISKGEPILAAKLAEVGARGGLATLLPDGMRAVAVRVDDVVGVAGFIHPGDRVDVVVTMQPRSDLPFTSKVILQNVKILAVGPDVQHKAKEAEKAVPATVATIMVTPEESESLALAATKGKLLLTLRGIGDDEFAKTQGSNPTALLSAAQHDTAVPQPAVQTRAAAPARRHVAPTAAPSPLRERVVEILRGDLYERRNFGKEEHQ